MTDHLNSSTKATPGLDRAEFQRLSEDAIALVRRWLTEADRVPGEASAQRLAGVLKDPNGLAFTVGFVDGVVRPEDLRVAAHNLAALAPKVPAFLPWYLRAAVRVGGAIAPVVPFLVVPVARRVLRSMVGHLIIDATDARLGRAIAKIRTGDIRLNMNLLGEAVLGEGEATRRLEGTHRLLQRNDVDYVSIKVSSTVAPHSPWAFDEAVEDVVRSLTPLFERAASSSPAKFINLDMEEYKDLDLTIAVFTKLLDQPQFTSLEAGIVLQAYLPDALSAMVRLQTWAAARRMAGGAAIKVRLVKGANLPMEQVEASLHDWPLATWDRKVDTDTNYKRLVNYALHPDRITNVRLGIAGHNLFDIAFAWLLANARNVQSGIEFEMLLGMATGQAEVVKRDVGSLLLYTPVVHPAEFDVAIAYLIRRLEEGASSENFMSAVFELSKNEPLFLREEQRFLASLTQLDTVVPLPKRLQDRSIAAAPMPTDSFHNTADTDPSLEANRAWGRDILNRASSTELGRRAVDAATLGTAADLTRVIDDAIAAGTSWGAMSGAERAEVLHRAGASLEANRANLMEIMAAEAGKTLDQSDPEVSEAVDFAHYYAEQARLLDTLDGARFVPSRLTVVTPPWNFPVAIPAGSTLAALAAGSAVIIKPARQASRTGAVMVEALWQAGVPQDVLQLVQLGERELGEQLISDPRVDRVILTGGYETAELFRSFREDLPLLAETSGKNSMIVTPSADFDLAVKDVVNSAFGHAGQKCSAASLLILVGSVATSTRFTSQLLDAVRSLTIGSAFDPTTRMGPLIGPASGKLLEGLTTLEAGERWLVEPRQLDESGQLWTPGVRAGVQRGSTYHLTEYFGPILGIITAKTLDEAIDIQNEVDYGLTAGLHSLEADEIGTWLDRVQAGNLYVNRGTTGAIVRRQPFGGWKKSAVGPGAKAGGPNYLLALGGWQSETNTVPVAGLLDDDVERLFAASASSGAGLDHDDIEYLRRCLASDAAAWMTEFGVARDVSKLSAERNVFRYRPVAATIRLCEGEPVVNLIRVAAAATLTRAPFSISSATAIPAPLVAAFGRRGIQVAVEDDATWQKSAEQLPGGRVRMLGNGARALAHATLGRPDLAIYAQPVTEAGRLELLPFLREQAVSITAHRFGTPSTISDALI